MCGAVVKEDTREEEVASSNPPVAACHFDGVGGWLGSEAFSELKSVTATAYRSDRSGGPVRPL